MPRLRSHHNYKYNQICSRNTRQIGAFLELVFRLKPTSWLASVWVSRAILVLTTDTDSQSFHIYEFGSILNDYPMVSNTKQ
jgi:hypothetical protein